MILAWLRRNRLPRCPECGGTSRHAEPDLPPEYVVCDTPGCCEILDA